VCVAVVSSARCAIAGAYYKQGPAPTGWKVSRPSYQWGTAWMIGPLSNWGFDHQALICEPAPYNVPLLAAEDPLWEDIDELWWQDGCGDSYLEDVKDGPQDTGLEWHNTSDYGEVQPWNGVSAVFIPGSVVEEVFILLRLRDKVNTMMTLWWRRPELRTMRG